MLKLLAFLEGYIGRAFQCLFQAIQSVIRQIGLGLARLFACLAALPSRQKGLAALAAVAAVLGSGAWALRDGPINWYEAAFDKRPLLRATSWHYQLDRIDIEAMRKIKSDVVVMDFAANGGTEALPKTEVDKMKVQPDGRRRLAISYISIGEAEHYRNYWKPEWNDPQQVASRPKWLGDANCAWPDNNAVSFWAPEWKTIIYEGPKSYIGQIIAAGFDGVYLDRVDIYDQYTKEKPDAEDLMVQFVTELAASARAMKPGFLIIAQNGEDLLLHKRYRRVIDGLGKEDLLHGLTGTGERNAAKDIAWSYDRIKLLLADNKPVFAVEYLVTREAMGDAKVELRERGLIPTFAHRNLDGSDPTLPRFEQKASMGTPEWIKQNCDGKKSW